METKFDLAINRIIKILVIIILSLFLISSLLASILGIYSYFFVKELKEQPRYKRQNHSIQIPKTFKKLSSKKPSKKKKKKLLKRNFTFYLTNGNIIDVNSYESSDENYTLTSTNRIVIKVPRKKVSRIHKFN